MTDPDLFVEFAPGAGPFDAVGDTYLLVDGGTDSFASTPDAATHDITGDIDVRVEVDLDSWVAPGPDGQALMGKWTGSGNQRSWVFWLWASQLCISWTTDGTNGTDVTMGSLSPIPWSAGRHAVRATLDVNDGASGKVATFYTADSIDGPWTQLSTETLSGTTSIFSGSSELTVAQIGNPDAADPAVGKFYAAEVYAGLAGTDLRAAPDFSAEDVGTTSFSDIEGLTWTVETGAEIAGFDWTDLSDRLLAADWTIGRDDELDHFSAGEATIVLKNDDRELDPDHTAGTWFGQLLPRVPFRLRSSSLSLDAPGVSGASVTTPDNAAYAITDLDVTIRVALDDWTPAATQIIVGQSGLLADIGWTVELLTTGRLRLRWSTTGALGAAIDRDTTNPLGFTDGTAHTLRVTMDVNDGGGNRVVTFYVDGVQLEQFTTAGTTSIFNSTQALTISHGSAPAAGRVYSATLAASIGGAAVANPDFTTVSLEDTSFVDSAGRTWTINGTAAIDFDTTVLIDQFYGFVDGGWEQDLRPPELANCTVKLVDKIGVLGGYRLPDIFEWAVGTASPDGFWVLDGESEGEEIADRSGNGLDGIVAGNVKFGEAPVTAGGSPSAKFEATAEDFGRIELGRSPILASVNTVTLVATFRARSAGTENWRCLFIQSDGNGATSTGIDALVDLTGRMNFSWVIGGGGITYETAASVVDGEGHIMFGQSDGLAIDTATLSTATSSIAPAIANGVGIGGFPGVQAEDHWDGWIGAVAVWDRQLLQQERQTILDGYGRLVGLRSDEHISWALDRLGIPLAARNLSEGTVMMGAANTADRDALEWIREVTATEQGGFYVDHRDGGKLRFTDRYHRFLESRSTIVQGSFSDNPAAAFTDVMRVERDDLDLAPNGTDSIINQVTVKWRGGEETHADDASVAAYGPRSRNVDTQATTAGQARSVAEWLVARYAEPRSRVRGVGINPGAARTAFVSVLDLRVDDLVDHRLHPQQVGTAVTTDLFVEGISHAVQGIEWETHYDLSPAETFTPWIWGVSEWDNETYWG